MNNTLYYGDNLDIMRKYIPDNSVDLIYLDPPFNSKANYNILYKEHSGKFSDAQITAFEDTWHWTEKAEETFKEIINIAPADVIDMMRAFRLFVGSNDMMAYLTMMCIRLVELRRVLKDTGSIYLHCDPTASHYLKIVMDTIFSKRNYRNEIVWCYRGGGYPRKDFGRRHDIILRYSKSTNYIFNMDEVREKYAETTKERFKHYIGNIRNGRDFGLQSLNPLGRHPDDWWEIQPIAPSAKERLGYPTQKPLKLLEKIIGASSNEGDVVLDPFCGCGTTMIAAQKLKRQWIGIDITHLAINLIKLRLKDVFDLKSKMDYKIIGEPEDLESAVELANQNRYQFQWWAISLIDAKPYGDKKKGRDTGIDGLIYFEDKKVDKGYEVKKCIVSVKSGNIQPKDIRDLGYVLDRESADIGIFITLQEPTRGIMTEAVSAGYYRSKLSGKDYPKIQILTIEELLKGKKPEIPNQISPFRKADPNEGEQLDWTKNNGN